MMRTAKFHELREIRRIDCETLPEKWHAPLSFYQKTALRNPEVFRVCEREGRIVGYHGLFPLKEETYDKLIRGNIDEKEIPELVRKPTDGKEICLYIGSVVALPGRSRTRIGYELIRDIERVIEKMKHEGVRLVKGGTFGVSKDGCQIANRFGMRCIGESEGVYVFEGEVGTTHFRTAESLHSQ